MKVDLPESRLPSLYRDFRPLKDLNPDGYEANISTWRDFFLQQYISNSNRIIFTIGTRTLQELTHEVYGVPKSIDIAIDVLVNEGNLIPMELFNLGGMYTDNSRKGFWKWVRSWKESTNMYKSRKDETNFYLREDKFIIKANLEKEYQRFHELLKRSVFMEASSITDLVFTRNEFVTTESLQSFFSIYDEETKNVFLHFIENYKHIIVSKDNVIKVIAAEVEDITSRFSKGITENDLRIASVKFQNNLAQVRTQIDTSATNAVLIQTLSESNEVIKSINGYIGSTEKVEDLLDEIKEGHDRTEEVNDLLAHYNKGQDEEAEEEIERELEQLELDEKNNNKEENKNQDLHEPKESSSEDLLKRLNNLKINTNEGPVQDNENHDNEIRKIMMEEQPR
ncbi:CBM_collapsed_G0031490.mRNA.1.CDS.1 [Saccharomyces cerevisiae]|nr:CBM_collapsed_G0031490.mRNA.1.CDS.1 [Saccharomyces cerevisiae]